MQDAPNCSNSGSHNAGAAASFSLSQTSPVEPPGPKLRSHQTQVPLNKMLQITSTESLLAFISQWQQATTCCGLDRQRTSWSCTPDSVVAQGQQAEQQAQLTEWSADGRPTDNTKFWVRRAPADSTHQEPTIKEFQDAYACDRASTSWVQHLVTGHEPPSTTWPVRQPLSTTPTPGPALQGLQQQKHFLLCDRAASSQYSMAAGCQPGLHCTPRTPVCTHTAKQAPSQAQTNASARMCQHNLPLPI